MSKKIAIFTTFFAPGYFKDNIIKLDHMARGNTICKLFDFSIIHYRYCRKYFPKNVLYLVLVQPKQVNNQIGVKEHKKYTSNDKYVKYINILHFKKSSWVDFSKISKIQCHTVRWKYYNYIALKYLLNENYDIMIHIENDALVKYPNYLNEYQNYDYVIESKTTTSDMKKYNLDSTDRNYFYQISKKAILELDLLTILKEKCLMSSECLFAYYVFNKLKNKKVISKKNNKWEMKWHTSSPFFLHDSDYVNLQDFLNN
tara:strand:- start:355 stop:1125 length:771 start_codon:yes stop_codon:yes gene_type:complete